jgi:hypothetical protein
VTAITGENGSPSTEKKKVELTVKMSLSTRILQKIVKNEAMATDPPEIYGWRVYLLACSVSHKSSMSIGKVAADG